MPGPATLPPSPSLSHLQPGSTCHPLLLPSLSSSSRPTNSPPLPHPVKLYMAAFSRPFLTRSCALKSPYHGAPILAKILFSRPFHRIVQPSPHRSPSPILLRPYKRDHPVLLILLLISSPKSHSLSPFPSPQTPFPRRRPNALPLPITLPSKELFHHHLHLWLRLTTFYLVVTPSSPELPLRSEPDCAVAYLLVAGDPCMPNHRRGYHRPPHHLLFLSLTSSPAAAPPFARPLGS